MEVFVLRIEDPGCFWVTMKGCGPHVVDEIEYKKLNAEMTQFYDKACEDEVKPITLEKDQLCVVFSEELKCWCRAVVKTIMYCADHYQIECFLVDYAKYVFVKSKHVRVAVEEFMQIPFRAKKCGLYRTKPVTLHVNLCEDTAKIVPAKRWDNAATRYFQSLLEATTQIKAKLCSVEDDTFHVILYVTIEDEKVCINDDLVLKKFAHFEEAKENVQSPTKEQDNQTSLNVDSPPVEIVNPALAFRLVWLQENVPMKLEAGHTASSSSLEKTYKRSNMDLNENNESVI
ncbi:putative ATP-dependent RNA helicase TDRD12 [Lagopus leucura]|uniref:putative ATP-dependent RNA helicase TDRD12 n=1 Tax=Lagopus leucura TaxID=30410 RepID=UPI001C67DF0C|nr:putative ATP-dependent RNA helicase TDRD12 [Lagopus leucura]